MLSRDTLLPASFLWAPHTAPLSGTLPQTEQCEGGVFQRRFTTFKNPKPSVHQHTCVSWSSTPKSKGRERARHDGELRAPSKKTGAVITTRHRSYFLSSQPPQHPNIFLLLPLPAPLNLAIEDRGEVSLQMFLPSTYRNAAFPPSCVH